MKKYFLLASFVAVILMMNQVSFAADEAVVDVPEPCSCCYCTATAQAAPMPFACPAPRMFGAKLQALLSQCPLKHRAAAFPCGPVPCDPCVEPAPAVFPCVPCAAPCNPAPRPLRDAFAARRAARLAQPSFACPSAPMVEPAPVCFATPTGMPCFAASVGQTGCVNYVCQRAATPVINLLSALRTTHRTPCYPYAAGGFYQIPVAPQPALTPVQ